MSLSKSEKKIIFENIDEIGELFNASEEREFIQKYFSETDIEECLQENKSHHDQTESLCLKMVMRSNKEFYDALSQYFLKRSDQYKKMFDRMVSGVEMSSREDCPTTPVSCSGTSPNQMGRDDRWTAQPAESGNHSDNANGKTLELTIHVLREKIHQIEEEREFWMRQSADAKTLQTSFMDAINQMNVSLQEIKANRGIQLFQYSAEARRRAEVAKFGSFGLRCILCSASGLFNVEIGEQGGGEDWSGEWRNMVGGSQNNLWWFLMMPNIADNLVVWMGLARRGDTLLIETTYRKAYVGENAPPQFTIDCEVSLIFENKDGTSTIKTQKKQHKMTLIDDIQSSEFLRFSGPEWGVVNPEKRPTVRIQLLNVEL